MNAPAGGDAKKHFSDLHRMPVGEELKIGTTPIFMPATGLVFVATGILFACMEYRIELYFGVFLAAAGVLTLFYRECVILDRRQLCFLRRSSLLFYVKQKSYSVADRAMVKITYFTLTDQEGQKSGSFDVRFVSFGAVEDDDEGELVLSTESHPRARAVAEQAARFFGLGIADFSSGKALVRDAQAVNESLRDRLARYGRMPVMPTRPARCRIRERVTGDQAEFRMPWFDAGLFRNEVASSCFSFAVVGLFIFQMLKSPKVWYLSWSVGGPVVLAPMILYALFALTFRERVRVGKQGLALLTSSIYTRRKRIILSEKLEELFIGVATDSKINVGREAVVARSDDLSLEFGARLSDSERRWLRDVIFYLVTAPEGHS